MDYFLLYNALGSQFNMKQERNVKELIITCLLVKIFFFNLFFFFFFFFFFFLAAPATCRSSWARDQRHATAVTQATAMPVSEPLTTRPLGNSSTT